MILVVHVFFFFLNLRLNFDDWHEIGFHVITELWFIWFHRYDILMICDEVMVGFGRTGRFFGFQHFEGEASLELVHWVGENGTCYRKPWI